MKHTALIIGTQETCDLVERQVALAADPPVSLGWIVIGDSSQTESSRNVLGRLDDLEMVIARYRPGMTLVSLPGAMHELIASIRTRLRRMKVADRFFPTIEDLLSGVGPRTNIDIDLSQLLDRPSRMMDEAAIRQVVGNRRVLITGAGGSIGSELARIVAGYEPRQLFLMDRSENALFEIDRQIARKHPELARKAILHDVVDAPRTLEIVRSLRPHLIFHAAAHKHVPMMEDHPAAAVDNNFFGTKSIADASAEVAAERFVFISTDKAVNPSSIMGATKRLAELYVQHLNRRSDTAFSIVRFGNVLGSSGSVLEIWAKQIADGGPLTVTDPAMTRYFMTIPEAASLVIQSAALVDGGGDVFLLDMGEPIKVVELAKRFASMYGLELRMPDDRRAAGRTGTIDLVFTGIRPGEKLHEELSFDAESMRPTCHPDINIWCLDPPSSRYMDNVLNSLRSCSERRPQEISAVLRRLLAFENLTPAELVRE